ncbi:MAG TPA: hypothetical protein PKB04_09090, partial [Phenylobacterium sp.]|nr:hypothetical protein [Phenylobacterium sp.]
GLRHAGHTAIARWVREEHVPDGWWAQAVTVSYERITGLRLPGQMADGTFTANVSRTMQVDADALRAVIQAGGFRPTADRSKVIILRRGQGGQGMMRTADLLSGLRNPAADLVPLRRFDIVYVPRSGVANAGLFVQQYFRDLSPIQFGFSYALNEQGLN